MGALQRAVLALALLAAPALAGSPRSLLPKKGLQALVDKLPLANKACATIGGDLTDRWSCDLNADGAKDALAFHSQFECALVVFVGLPKNGAPRVLGHVELGPDAEIESCDKLDARSLAWIRQRTSADTADASCWVDSRKAYLVEPDGLVEVMHYDVKACGGPEEPSFGTTATRKLKDTDGDRVPEVIVSYVESREGKKIKSWQETWKKTADEPMFELVPDKGAKK